MEKEGEDQPGPGVGEAQRFETPGCEASLRDSHVVCSNQKATGDFKLAM